MRFKARLAPEHIELLHNLVAPISRLNPSSPYSDLGGSVTTMLFLDDHRLLLSTQGGSGSGTASGSRIPGTISSTQNRNVSISSSMGTGGGGGGAGTSSTSFGGGGSNDAEGIFCFAEMATTDGIFKWHKIESLENDNAILMEVCLSQLRTALRGILGKKSGGGSGGGGSGTGSNGDTMVGSLYDQHTNPDSMAASSYEVTMKLAKRNGGVPHLCLDSKATSSGNSGGFIDVHHAIPVRIRKVEELQYHVPPRMDMPDVQLNLPNAIHRPLRMVVERLRSMSPHVFLEGSMTGTLALIVEGDGASIRTTYNKLIPVHKDTKSQTQTQQHDNDDDMDCDDESRINTPKSQHVNHTQGSSNTNTAPAKCKLKLDIKKLHASLHWQNSLAYRDVCSATLCMWENEMLVLDVHLFPEIGRFMYYIPVHFISDDWE